MKSKGARVRSSAKRTAPLSLELEVPSMNPDDPYCFLITPFDNDPERAKVRREGIDPATRRFGFPTYRVDEIPSTDDRSALTCLVDARVRSVDPSRPVEGKVTFVFHESFVPRRETTRARHGEALCKDIDSYGTFTLGVELHRAGVCLELDLATVPGAGAEFRRR